MMPEIFGSYRLTRFIATGGMAEILLCHHVDRPDEKLAIKRVLPQFADDQEVRNMFLDEASLVSRLSHPNIVKVVDSGEVGNRVFLVMEYIKGRVLRHAIRRLRRLGKRMSVADSLEIISCVLRALHYAHELTDEKRQPLDIIHRDISSQNVMLGVDGSVKLLDFGIAKVKGRLSASRAGVVKGKYCYMSPEQAQADGTVDRRTDVFSAGLVLYEMLTGNMFYWADQPLKVYRIALAGPAPAFLDAKLRPIDKSMPRLGVILRRALASNRDERYPTAMDFVRDLLEASFELEVPPLGVERLLRAVEHIASTKSPAGREAKQRRPGPRRERPHQAGALGEFRAEDATLLLDQQASPPAPHLALHVEDTVMLEPEDEIRRRAPSAADTLRLDGQGNPIPPSAGPHADDTIMLKREARGSATANLDHAQDTLILGSTDEYDEEYDIVTEDGEFGSPAEDGPSIVVEPQSDRMEVAGADGNAIIVVESQVDSVAPPAQSGQLAPSGQGLVPGVFVDHQPPQARPHHAAPELFPAEIKAPFEEQPFDEKFVTEIILRESRRRRRRLRVQVVVVWTLVGLIAVLLGILFYMLLRGK